MSNLQYIVEGNIVVLTGWPTKSFIHHATRDQDVRCMVLNASERTVPDILSHCHPTMLTAVLVDSDTPERRFAALCELADAVLHVRDRTAIVARDNSIRQRINLRQPQDWSVSPQNSTDAIDIASQWEKAR